MEFREALDIRGRQQLRKAESILRGGAQNVLLHEATNLTHLYAQHGRRFSIVEKAFWGHSDARHRPILTEQVGWKKISGDPGKPIGVADRYEIASENSADDGGKSDITAKIVFESMSKCDERPWL
jgi:hypothetical protein